MYEEKQTVERAKTSLELDEALALQEKGWAWQKAGWVFIWGLMLAGGLGLFGEGWLSEKTATAGQSKVNYERFFRYEVEMKVNVQCAEHISSISLPEKYLKEFRIVRFVPEPSNNTSHKGRIKYNFLPTDNHIVSIYMITKDYGSINGIMSINEKDSITLNHFIFP